MNILILGHGRHGKDTAAEYLESQFGLSFNSSSWEVATLFYKANADLYGYRNITECYNDRSNKRPEWHKFIVDYNTPDKTRLARRIFDKSNVYVGMRCNKEYRASFTAGLFDQVLWIDASERLPLEPASSFNIDFVPGHMWLIDNNRSTDVMYKELNRWAINIAQLDSRSKT